MGWHKIELSQSQVANSYNELIQKDFELIFSSSGSPKGFCLFSSKITGKGSTIYISPIASEQSSSLILKYSGQTCPAPSEESVFFWLGNDEDKSYLSNANK